MWSLDQISVDDVQHSVGDDTCQTYDEDSELLQKKKSVCPIL